MPDEAEQAAREFQKQFEKAGEDFCQIKTRVAENQIYLSPEQKRESKKIITVFKKNDIYGTDFGYRAVIAIGAPGTGKSLWAQYLATQLDAELRHISHCSHPMQVSMYMHKIRELQEKTKRKQLVYLDEIHKYGSRDGGMTDPTTAAVLDQWLIEINSVEVNDNIYFVGSTDKPEKLDGALKRWKRMGKQIGFFPPDEKGRYEILKILVNNYSDKEIKKLKDNRKGHKFECEDKVLKHAAQISYGFNGDDLYGLLAEASASVLTDENSMIIKKKHIDDALNHVYPSALSVLNMVKPTKKFSELGGLDGHIEMIKDAVTSSGVLKKKTGLNFLFHGASGCGKDATAEAIAAEYNIPLIYVNGSELMNSLVGQTGDNISQVFRHAKIGAPSVINFSELQSLVQTKGYMGYKDTWTGRMRAELNKDQKGVIIVGTLLDPSILEAQTLRRFHYQFEFGMPDKEGKKQIWDIYTKKYGVDFDTSELVDMSTSMSGANIENICSNLSRHRLKASEEVFKTLMQFYDDENDKIATQGDKYKQNDVDLWKVIKSLKNARN